MSAGPRRDPGLQPERTSLAWRRTVLALVVVDLLVWRSWALAVTRAAPGSAAGAPDYLGICALTAMAATVVLCLCVLARGRELRSSSAAPRAALMRWAAAAVVVLAGSAVAAVALGR
ncbi:DUF202 domain-containing protein [Arthrobacter sp. PAMC25564]|uniref:DUF202 domain-containing protein n=1 Tax=Arthrobacter sp. PAMC25564 TaxID=2565366 RepID=UPI0010A25C73|nr:DUF202 domain-containing protein [Arthrobacter sp. PAMC25564]QCB97058.1 DUF202 domain-containing protein [Arthrobacter sp. PAMC25564]